ncbi:MAG: O-antigen ligase family protein [Lachnospiraceae bacterium]|nr:O-antigen ligase family protein [Lachnospiraceae bacterium]
MNKKDALKTTILSLLMFVFLIPGDSYRRVYVGILFILFLLIDGKLYVKKFFSIGWMRWVYVITFIGSYCIHYYKWSIPIILLFISFFILARYIIITGITNEKLFEYALNIILFVFTIYAILGIIEAFTQFNFFDLILGRSIELYGANNFRGNIYRGHGISTVSINNAMIVYAVWMLATYKIYSKKPNFFAIVEFVVIGCHLVLIFSRMLILIGLISQILIFAKARKVTKLRIVFLILFAILISMFVPQSDEGVLGSIVQSFIPLFEELKNGRQSTGINWGGTGERLIIWQWVFSKMQKVWLLGNGFETEFAYSYFYQGHQYIKQSIEVHWLYVLFQKGIFGLFGFISYQIYSISKIAKNRKLGNHNNISFPYIFLIMTIGYFISLFTCAGLEDLYFYYIFFSLFEAYSIIESKNIQNKISIDSIYYKRN